MTSPVLELTDLVKEYPAPDGPSLRVLDIPHVVLERGQQLALAGPSGSGKTTLLHCVAGLLVPTGGVIHVLGAPINRMGEAERDRFRAQQIGYVFQRANLLDGFSALENVLLAMGFANLVPAAQRRAKACDLLEQVGLAERLNYRPGQLSSGQQQRVALARALANQPALVLADEPTASVDHATGQQLVALLQRFCAERGAALLLVSHDRSVLGHFDDVADLCAGRIEPRHVASAERVPLEARGQGSGVRV